MISANDWKGQLDCLTVSSRENCFDTAVAAYLIEPIQKGFMEEDLAENYGDISFYPYSQMFGKMAFETAFDEKKEEVLNTYAIVL